MSPPWLRRPKSDLSPTTLYHVWLRMQLGSIIAYLVGILYNYVGDKIIHVRQVGIRCAMEFGDVRWYLEHGNAPYRKQGETLLQELAKKLEWNPASVKVLVYTLDEDSQLNFIYDLWDDAFRSNAK